MSAKKGQKREQNRWFVGKFTARPPEFTNTAKIFRGMPPGFVSEDAVPTWYKISQSYLNLNLLINYNSTANPTWGDIFERCFKAQSSKLESLFSTKRCKRDLRALSFEPSKMTPQEGTGTLPDYLVIHVLTKNVGPHPKKIAKKSRISC